MTAPQRPVALPVQPAGIPVSLLGVPRWVVWRYVLRGEKWTKPPYQVDGRSAKSTDAATWNTFAAVYSAYLAGGWDGIGYAMTADDAICGADLDECNYAAARPLLDALNSYTEISPGGHGYRVIFEGRKPGAKAKKLAPVPGVKAIEIYDDVRYLTITGHRIDGYPVGIESRQAELDAVYMQLWPAVAPVTPPQAQPHQQLSDDAVLALISTSKQAERFEALHGGDTSDYGDDLSAADMAYCSILAFWTGRDATQIDRLYRSSELVRAKWDEKRGDRTYGEITLQKAVEDAREVYSPPGPGVDTAAAFGNAGGYDALLDRIRAEGGNLSLAPGLMAEINATPWSDTHSACLRTAMSDALRDAGMSAADARKHTQSPAAVTPVDRYGKNHTINAQLFIAQCYPADALINVEQDFYAYSGKVWEPRSDASVRASIARVLLASQPSSGLVEGTYSIVTNLCHSDGDAPGAGPADIIVFDNMVLRLADNALMPHSPAFKASCLLPFDYTPGAQCPQWQAWLLETFGGDAERVALLQEWFGYCLSNSYDFHKILVLIGAPRSGKGTIGRILHHVVGDANFTGGSLLDFTSNSMLNMWRHKTVLFIGDAQSQIPRQHAGTVVERIKQISGNDAVAFDRKYKAAMSTTLPTRITIAGNSIPKFFDDSGALSSRLMPLHTEGSHEGNEDLSLFGRLVVEAEGILQWALVGRTRLFEQGRFTVPAAMEGERQYIRESFSPAEAFLADCCSIDGESTVSSKDLYIAYHRWALANGEDQPMRQAQFTGAVKQAVTGRGARYQSTWNGGKAVRGFTGLAVTSTQPAPFADNKTQ